MNNSHTMQAAQYLQDLWRSETRCRELPEHLRPATRTEGYRVQAGMEHLTSTPLCGWKIAATSIAGQKHIGVDGPLAGRYISERTVASGAAIPFGKNHMAVAEIEFAFRLGEDLPPRNHPYTEDDVFRAVASMHPAIEIPDSRFDRFETVGAPQLIADNACAGWLVVGNAAPGDWRDIELSSFQPTGRVTGKPDVVGIGSNVLGSPRIALTWPVNELSSLGLGAKAGQTVTTGTCLVPMKISVGDQIEGDFGSLGHVSVTIE